MSRPQVQQARSRHHSHVATSFPANQNRPGRDLKNGVATPVSIGQLEPCRDINRCRDITQATPGRDTKTRSRPSWRLPYVATSISCRDLVSTHSGISRSQHQNSRSRPPLLLPMLRPQNDVVTSNQLSPSSTTSRRHFPLLRPPLLTLMSRPQN